MSDIAKDEPLEPVVLDMPQREAIDEIIQLLRTFKLTGNPAFYMDACLKIQTFGTELIEQCDDGG